MHRVRYMNIFRIEDGQLYKLHFGDLEVRDVLRLILLKNLRYIQPNYPCTPIL